MLPDKDGTYWIKYRDPHLDGTQGQYEVESCIAAFDKGWVVFIGTEVPGDPEHVLEIGPEIVKPENW